MNSFYHSGLLEALGWSLVDSLWQMGILWLLYVLITANGKRSSASSRYTFALLAVVVGCIWFVVSFGLNYNQVNGSARVFGLAYLLGAGLPSVNEQVWMPLVSTLYILTVLFYAARWIIQFAYSRKVYREAAGVPNSFYVSLIGDLKQLTGTTRDVRLWVSEKIVTPITYGFLRPVILLPAAAFAQLTTRQVEALIIHEFYHIKRNDYLVNIFMSLGEILLFFNPFAKLLIGNARKERENCCDDEVLGLGYDPWEYAQALYFIGKNNVEKYHFALAATGKGKQLLLQRVKRMLNRRHAAPSFFRPLSIFFLCLAAASGISKEANKMPPARTVKPAVATETAAPAPVAAGQVSAHNNPQKPRATNTKTVVKTEAVVAEATAPPLPPTPRAPEQPVQLEEPVNYENDVVASYVSYMRESLEFSLREAPISCPDNYLETTSSDASHPYIPGSTFYFPGHEMAGVTKGKTTVQL